MTTVKTLKRTFVYTRIADNIAEKIASGELAPGSFLLSERKLAGIYKVNHATARKATQLLVDKGLVKKIQGQGVLVAENQKRKRTTKFIGFILCKRKKSNPFYFELISYIEKELKKLGFHLVYTSFDNSSSKNEVPNILTSSAVDGVIVTGEIPHKLLSFLQKNKVNHVLIDRSNTYNGKSNIVSTGEDDIGYKAGKYLFRKHKKIAFIKGSEKFRPHDMLRENGLMRAAAECGYKFDKKMIIECSSFEPCEIRKAASTLLKKEHPNAVFASNIKFANEMADVCLESGIKIPKEIEFAFYSATDKNIIPSPLIIQANNEGIGRAAVNRLLDIINGRAVGTSINLIPAISNKSF